VRERGFAYAAFLAEFSDRVSNTMFMTATAMPIAEAQSMTKKLSSGRGSQA
jgi:hypothetical protein